MSDQYADSRREYSQGTLSEAVLTDSPFSLFENWFQQVKNSQTNDPTAMVLSTVDRQHFPSQRIVLLKGVDPHGFRFFTNLTSQKATDIANNPSVSLHFPWHPMERQVIVRGTAHLIPRNEVEAYFHSRPRESQLGAWASRQSEVVDSRETIEQRYQKYQQKFVTDIPVPDFWGGYCVVPKQIEFWQGGENRLHDRFVYHRDDSGWKIQRLMP